MSKKGFLRKTMETSMKSNGKIVDEKTRRKRKKKIRDTVIYVSIVGGLFVGGYNLVKNGTWKDISDVNTSMSNSSSNNLNSNNSNDINNNDLISNNNDINNNDDTSTNSDNDIFNSDTSNSDSNISNSATTSNSDTSNVEDSFVDFTPVYLDFKAEDVIKLSESFAEYLNKEATLSHVNYKFCEIKPKDLYSVVYLANIDNISKEETETLIEAELISSNIQKNIENSFYFYNLYTDDTINKIDEGKTNLIDLSFILSNKHDIKTFNIMNKIMIDSITNTPEENYKNYVDTAFYYASGVTISNSTYDYSQSVYETDRDKLTVGGNYTLSFVATTIDFISFNNKVATKGVSKILQSGANDFANVTSIFNGCKVDPEIIEKDNQYTK